MYIYIYTHIFVFGGLPNLGVPFWGAFNKNFSILGSILGSPYLLNYANYHHAMKQSPNSPKAFISSIPTDGSLRKRDLAT